MAGIATGTKFTDYNVKTLTQKYGTATSPATGAQSELVAGHGAIFGEYIIDELVTLATDAAYTDTTALIPAGTALIQTATYVHTTLAGNSVSTYSLGVSGATARFQGTTTNITAADTNAGSSQTEGTVNYASATAIRITCDQTVTSGKIRVVARCLYICPPTS